MTWKLNKLTRLTLLSLCSLALSLFLCSSSASAVSIWSTGRWGSGQTWHDFELQGRSDLPWGAFPYNPSTGGATLYGARIENGGYRVGDSSKRFNVVNIVFTLQQDLSFGSNTLNPNVGATGYVYDKNDNYISGPCSPYKEYDKLSWSCSIRVDNYSDFEWFGIDIGNIHHPEAPSCDYDYCPSDAIGFWAQFPTGQYGANLVYYAWSYTVQSSDDPVVSGLSDLVSQNSQMIQQNIQILDSISAQTNAINNQTDAINSQTDQLLGALNNQTSQEHSDYEAEKEEEAQRESDINDSMDELSGVFSFTAFNPFSPILELFSSGNSCVHIPIIASWIHLSNDEVCPFFSVEVRQILTPVFGISAMMLLFGFFIHWLNGTGGDNSLDVGDENGYFRGGL